MVNVLRDLAQTLHPVLTIVRSWSMEFFLCLDGLFDSADLDKLWRVPVDIADPNWDRKFKDDNGIILERYRVSWDAAQRMRMRIIAATRDLRHLVSATSANSAYPRDIMGWHLIKLSVDHHASGGSYSYNIEVKLGSEYSFDGYIGSGAPAVGVTSLEEWVTIVRQQISLN
jgi:hypothetical protein